MNDRLGRWLMQQRLSAVRPHISGRLLDIGCGNNALVRSHGHESVGVDVYQWGDVDLVVPDTASLPFPARSFDTVTIIAALNHIPNRLDVLREAHRVLRPGGKIVLTMIPPTISQVWHFLRRPWDADQRERGMKQGEVWGLTRRAVIQMLADAGFHDIRQRGFMMGINTLSVATRGPESTVSGASAA